MAITSVSQADSSSALVQIESHLVGFLEQNGLPSQQIFVDLDERAIVFANAPNVIKKLSADLKNNSVYLSKMLAACAAGLFDAALNYLWDETILQLRKRVAQYDLDFFYDNTVGGDKRNKYNTEEDLENLQDCDLIRGAREIELISDVGHVHLEYIGRMRNWVSAAHPNQYELTGLKILSWFETCYKEVLSLPLPPSSISIKQFLANLRRRQLPQDSAKENRHLFSTLSKKQFDRIASALFGIYTREDSEEFARNNVRMFWPIFWAGTSEGTKKEIGLKLAYFSVNQHLSQKQRARELLDQVDGQKYIPDEIRATEIDQAIEYLTQAHNGMNNFYTEPGFARDLNNIIGKPPKVPTLSAEKYVTCLLNVYLTNGNGVCWSAEPIYVDLISSFSLNEATLALTILLSEHFSGKYQFSLCETKFRELIDLITKKTTNPVVNELLTFIENYTNPVSSLIKSANMKRILNRI